MANDPPGYPLSSVWNTQHVMVREPSALIQAAPKRGAFANNFGLVAVAKIQDSDQKQRMKNLCDTLGFVVRQIWDD